MAFYKPLLIFKKISKHKKSIILLSAVVISAILTSCGPNCPYCTINGAKHYACPDMYEEGFEAGPDDCFAQGGTWSE